MPPIAPITRVVLALTVTTARCRISLSTTGALVLVDPTGPAGSDPAVAVSSICVAECSVSSVAMLVVNKGFGVRAPMVELEAVLCECGCEDVGAAIWGPPSTAGGGEEEAKEAETDADADDGCVG